jgi:hypothetical protein
MPSTLGLFYIRQDQSEIACTMSVEIGAVSRYRQCRKVKAYVTSLACSDYIFHSRTTKHFLPQSDMSDTEKAAAPAEAEKKVNTLDAEITKYKVSEFVFGWTSKASLSEDHFCFFTLRSYEIERSLTCFSSMGFFNAFVI